MSSMQQADDALAELEAERLAERLQREREDALRRTDINELKRLLAASRVKADMLQTIAEHAPLLTPPTLTRYPGKQGRPRHVWVLMVSDLQHGQKTTLGDSGHLYEQSSSVSTLQFEILWRKVDELARIASKSKAITEFWIMFLGDIQEGDSLRVSQATKIDKLAMPQCVDVVNLESALITNALARFPRVRVRIVGGNHDRVSAKPGTGGLGELGMLDTYAWLAGAMLEIIHQPAIASGRLDLVNHEAWFGGSIIAGQRVTYEHGASFKASTGSYGGLSYYSIANAAQGYMRMLDGADLVLMGHFHTPMILPLNGGRGFQILNGAFPPSTEFVQSRFKSVGRPQQWLLDLHEEYGLVGATPIYVGTEHMQSPDAFWRMVAERDGATA
jgi:predicted phosphodiesterase